MTTDPPPCTPENTEPVKACCKCQAYQEINAALNMQVALMKKELANALTHFEAARRYVAAAEKIMP